MNIANLFQGLALLGWVAAIAVVVLAVVQAGRGKPMRRATVTVGIVLVLAVLFSTVSAGLVFINPQERGVVISAVAPNGYRETALQPGLRWIIPFAESVVTYPISRQTYTMSIAPAEGQIQGDDSITARTSDGQEIYVDASVIYAIDPEKVTQVHIQWQDRYSADLVRAQSRGIIRDAVSQYGVEEVVSSKRTEMVQKVTDTLTAKLSENGLILIDFVLRNITFSPEYAASVEQKQIAEQLAQQAFFVVEQRKQEAEQARQVAEGKADAAVIEAKGAAEARLVEADAEAKALDLINAAIANNPDLLTYTYIQKLSPNIEVMLLPNDTPFLFPLPETVNNGVLTPEVP
ncbi:MAG: prohibitin family protein [Anaerolineae bacterium]|nr:prohibitin family protein [Anaerolineae bacterium]